MVASARKTVFDLLFNREVYAANGRVVRVVFWKVCRRNSINCRHRASGGEHGDRSSSSPKRLMSSSNHLTKITPPESAMTALRASLNDFCNLLLQTDRSDLFVNALCRLRSYYNTVFDTMLVRFQEEKLSECCK